MKNSQIDNFKISLLKEPNCNNIFNEHYYYNINEKYIQLNIIDNNSYLDADELIFVLMLNIKILLNILSILSIILII